MRVLRKPKYYLVPCDLCRSAIGEDCDKCGGAGTVAIVEKKK
jgi:hypothetical protein